MNQAIILCVFYAGGPFPGAPSCKNKAVGFVRVHHSGRLSPLCDSCGEMFAKGSEQIGKVRQIQRVLPGDGTYSDVSLEDGMEEYLKQSPRTPEMEEKAVLLREELKKAHELSHKN